ncbi:hypothetical protein CDL12_24939 [Handroanthus impetiginosus]|uniref:Mitochondrial transcription termination factor, mTERF n=1 Tax=Handroanthus impetiginosus TaxID=429701 RepID=A0A2G9GB93_9LAMI|nr:hypothetical protein CDL12_24939 [Handroanthus impetiginosus]
MLLRRNTTTSAAAVFSRLTITISHYFLFSTTTSNLSKPFSKIPWKHRSKAIQEAQKALIDYLHITRSLPFLYAESIASNSPHSLWKIASKIPFSSSTFEYCFQRFLRMFYDLGCEMGKLGELMGRSRSIFVVYAKEALSSKVEYFCRLNVAKDQIGLFLLSSPEVFGYDLEDRVISVSGILKHFGLAKNEVKSLKQKYPHVFGRNIIANLPHIMRSMDLGEWFFERVKNGNHTLLETYSISSMEDLDKHYEENLRKIRAKRTYSHSMKKLKFLHGIGFGENRFAVKALGQLNSSRDQLQQRFDCLLQFGIEYSKLCAMLRFSAKILNQQEGILEKKLMYLCTDIGSPLHYLDIFPGYLCYDLEKRIKPRYTFHKWLTEQGFSEKNYSLSTIIASSEKTFIGRISRIYPAAVEKWQEYSASFKENSAPQTPLLLDY